MTKRALRTKRATAVLVTPDGSVKVSIVLAMRVGGYGSHEATETLRRAVLGILKAGTESGSLTP